jgi:hypothetical protein
MENETVRFGSPEPKQRANSRINDSGKKPRVWGAIAARVPTIISCRDALELDQSQWRISSTTELVRPG